MHSVLQDADTSLSFSSSSYFFSAFVNHREIMDPRGMRKKVAEAAARLRLSKARRDLAKLKAAKKMIEEERAEAAAEERAAAELNDTEYIRWPAFRVMETIPEISETKSVDIQVHGMKARFYLSRPDEDIVPLRYLKRADKDSEYIYPSKRIQYSPYYVT